LAIALQEGLQMTAIVAGLALVPFALAFFAASLSGPRLITRLGAARVVSYGSVLQLIGGIVLAFTVFVSWPHVDAWGLIPAFVLIGFSLGAQFPVLFGIMLSGVPRERAGVGSGVMSTAQQASLALGTAIVGSLFEGLIGPVGFRDSLLITLMVLIGLTVLTGALSLRLPRKAP
jgi:MFS family permease